MKYLTVVLVCLLLWPGLVLADPFADIPADSAERRLLLQLSEAGLLGSSGLPQDGLSRLEAAVLLQGALQRYAARQLSGAERHTAEEAALGLLLQELQEELGMIGTQVALPLSVADGPFGPEQLISVLQLSRTEHASQPDSSAADLPPARACCPPEPEDPCPAKEIEVGLGGFFQLQSRLDRLEARDGTATDSDSMSIYYGELGWDAAIDDWSGRFSVNFDEAENDVVMYEAWARYDDPESPFYLQFGQLALPFADNPWYFPSNPASNDLGFTTTDAIGAGWEGKSSGFQAYMFNPEAEMMDEDDTFSDFAAVWDVSHREAGECSPGWALTAGYTSNLAEADMEIAGAELHSHVPGLNLSGQYDAAGNRWHLLADYTAALEDFDAADLDVNADGVGDRPAALNLEAVWEPHPEQYWGLNYQACSELADYAETRCGVMYGQRLNRLAMLKLEYSHGNFGGYVTELQDKEDSFVAEISLEF